MIYRRKTEVDGSERLTRGEVMVELLDIWEHELEYSKGRKASKKRNAELLMIAIAIEVLKVTYNVKELMDFEGCVEGVDARQ